MAEQTDSLGCRRCAPKERAWAVCVQCACSVRAACVQRYTPYMQECLPRELAWARRAARGADCKQGLALAQARAPARLHLPGQVRGRAAPVERGRRRAWRRAGRHASDGPEDEEAQEEGCGAHRDGLAHPAQGSAGGPRPAGTHREGRHQLCRRRQQILDLRLRGHGRLARLVPGPLPPSNRHWASAQVAAPHAKPHSRSDDDDDPLPHTPGSLATW